MKKLFFIVSLLISVASFGQFPITQGFGTRNTITNINGAARVWYGIIHGRYADTATANADWIAAYPGAEIIVGDTTWIRNLNATMWLKQGGGTGGGSSNIYTNGLYKSNDSVWLGNRMDLSTITVVPNYRQIGMPTTRVEWRNRGGDSSRNSNYHHVPLLQGTSQDPSLGAFSRRFEEKWGDTDPFLYGSALGVSTWNGFDSASTHFKYDNFTIGIPIGGVHGLQDVFLPRDSVYWFSGRDGQNAAIFQADLNIGDFWGYNVVIQPYVDRFPIAANRTNVDLVRNIDNNRKKVMHGPITGYQAGWKGYQSTIFAATADIGNYWEHIAGFTDFGDLYPTVGHASATKAEILATATADSVFGFISRPKWRIRNIVKNGYGFVQYGFQDRNLFEGATRFGNWQEGAKIPGADSAVRTVEVFGSQYLRDSAILDQTIAVPDSTGMDIMVKDRASKVVKYIRFDQLPSSITGGVNWGDIGGTIADQTDLIALINRKLSLNLVALNAATVSDAPVINYFFSTAAVWQTSPTTYEMTIDRTCTLAGINLELQCATAGTAEAWTIYVRNNTTATDHAISTLSVSANRRTWSNTAMNIAVTVGDKLIIKSVNPAWATNPANCLPSGYIYFK